MGCLRVNVKGGTSWAVPAGVLGFCCVSRECASCRGDGVTEQAGVNGVELTLMAVMACLSML